MSSNRMIVSAAIAATLGWLACGAELAPVPEVTVPMYRRAPALDGALDDAWRTAAVLDRFSVLSETGGTATNQTVYLMRDPDWLYVGCDIKHPMPKAMQQTVFDAAGSVNRDDSVEFFLDPGTDGALYYHFIISAFNVRSSKRVIKQSERDLRWAVPWRAAARTTDSGWQLEMAFPLGLLMPYGAPNKARLNVAINQVIPVIDPQGVRMDEKQRHLLWSPVYRTFHEPARFGLARGLTEPYGAPFLAMIKDAAVGGYTNAGAGYQYEVSGTIQSFAARPGAVRVTVADRPAGSAGQTITQSVDLLPGKLTAFRAAVPVRAIEMRQAVVSLADADTGLAWEQRVLSDFEKIKLMRVCFDRTYYTTETNALLLAWFELPAALLAGTRLRAAGAQSAAVFETAPAAAETQLPIPLAQLDQGRHEFSVTLQNAAGAAMLTGAVALVKLPPNPGFEYKVDRLNRVLLRDGRPFFPFGLDTQGMAADDREALKEIAGLGFNTVLFATYATAKNRSPLESAPEYIRNAQAAGLNVIGWPDLTFADNAQIRLKGKLLFNQTLTDSKRTGQYSQSLEKQLPAIERGITAVKAFPNLIAYYSLDEPVAFQIPAGRLFYQRMHAIDGYRPVILNYSSFIPAGEEFTDWCDILATDPYWTPGARGNRGVVNFVAETSAETDRRAEGLRQMTYTILAKDQTCMYKRAIMPEEHRAQAYLAVINGVRGIHYFIYPFEHALTRKTLGELAVQFKTLGPIATTPPVKQQIVYNPPAAGHGPAQPPDVQARLFRRPEGGFALCAANSQPYPVEARYTLALLPPTGLVNRLFAADAYAVSNSSFGDTLAPFDVRAYTFAGADPGANPVRIEVALTPHPEQAAARFTGFASPRRGREGKRNLMPNPSFEEASLPEWPDYVRYIDLHGKGPVIGDPGARWGQDTNAVYHGRASLRITGRSGSWYRYLSWWPSYFIYLAPALDRPRSYVMSAYIKASQPGMRAVLTGVLSRPNTQPDLDKTGFALTTEWQRYSETGLLDPRSITEYHAAGVSIYGEGTAWIDAVQFEPGETPTEFEP